MKPTTDEMLAWAQEAGWMKVLWKDQYADGTDCIKKLAALAYAAGAKAMKERCTKVCREEASRVVANADEKYQQGREMGATVCGMNISALEDDDE